MFTRQAFRADLSAIFVDIFGYFAQYKETGESLWFRAGVLLISLVSLVIADFSYYSRTKFATILLDIPVIIIMFLLLENLRRYSGIPLILALALCLVYGFITKKYRKKMLEGM